MKKPKKTNDYKNKIYKAAEQLFYDKGYKDTSVMDIIELSGTNKGSFYHYYSSKAKLAEAVLLNSHFQHTEIREIFKGEDSLVLHSLENLALWYSYFNDQNLMRFSTDLNRESLHFETRYIYDPCFEHTEKKFSRKEFSMIVAANQGMRRSLNILICNKTNQYSFEDPAFFYQRHLYRMFYISEDVINATIKRAEELFSQIDIKIDRFSWYCKKK